MPFSTKIFYDGCDIVKYGSISSVVGFTTNTTIMRQSNQLNFTEFYNTNKKYINDRPISFQIFSDDVSMIKEQARKISAIGKNVYSKIPVINSRGEQLIDTALELLNEGVKVNITAVFTINQIDLIASKIVNVQTPTIVSVFGGRISDAGVNPKATIKYAVDSFKSNPNIEVLWAGCRDNLVIEYASEIGCHIVTLPDAVISRIHRIGQSLDNLSQEVVNSFLKDAVDGGLQID
jgi:transaldolase